MTKETERAYTGKSDKHLILQVAEINNAGWHSLLLVDPGDLATGEKTRFLPYATGYDIFCMSGMNKQQLLKPALILAIIIAAVIILVYGKPFLVPLTFAALLAMLLLRVVKFLQKKRIPNVLAILMSMLLLLAFFALVIFFASWQISDIAGNASKIEQQLAEKYTELQQQIAGSLGISPEKQEQFINKQKSSFSGQMGSLFTGLLAGMAGFVTDTILVLVYIFLFLFFRQRLKTFILKMVPKEEMPAAQKTMNSAQKVTQQYLTGLFLMIVGLWIMYTIGFTIAGVKNAFFFAILCGLLELVPFVGNLAGTALTLFMSLAQGGGTNVIIGVLVTYVVVQFVQSYLLEPLVVGAEVKINPLFIIIGLVAGEALWGIPGMILAIPLLGIAKIICEHIEGLKPVAYLMGKDKK